MSNETLKKWRLENPEKYEAQKARTKEKRRLWRLANPGEAKAKEKLYRDSHLESGRASVKKWTKNNPEKVKLAHKLYNSRPEVKAKKRERARLRRLTPEWQEYMYKYNHSEAGKEAQRKYDTANPEKVKLKNRRCKLKRAYGISIEDYDSMLLLQEGKCAICGSTDSGKKDNTFSIDHDHNTGKVRSLLCSNCNFVLGLVGDNISILQKSIDYIKKHP